MPAETLPVRTRTLFVAAMPVPASPSGGQSGAPGSSVPVGSSSFAPSAVSVPASSPAVRTAGKIAPSFHGKPLSACSASNFSIISASNAFVSLSIGNMPEASPMPSTFSPVSFQWT